MSKKTALITGITGQDGSYLTEFLLEKGYVVHGIIRRSSSFNTARIDHLYKDIHNKNSAMILHYGDLTDTTNLFNLIEKIAPDEIYNLGAQSHVQVSFETPEYTANADAVGVLRILEAIRSLRLSDSTRFYQASTSEVFGLVQEVPQSERTPFHPRSPYGVAKQFGYWITVNYREGYNIFASNGILFNHESPRRGGTFVTKKVVSALCKIKAGLEDCLFLGNLEAKRDWGYAKDYVEAMWLILQHDTADDFVIATGKTYSIREFVEQTCLRLNIKLRWEGQGTDEVGIDATTGKTIIRIDPRYFRPAEVDLLLGDASKAKKVLGWEPRVNFFELIDIMVESEEQHIAQLKKH